MHQSYDDKLGLTNHDDVYLASCIEENNFVEHLLDKVINEDKLYGEIFRNKQWQLKGDDILVHPTDFSDSSRSE